MFNEFESFYGNGFMQIFLIAALLGLVVTIFYLITLQKTLQAISPQNRLMPPANVWLLLIPLFNLVWQFIVINKIADSIKLECIRLNIPTNEDRPTHKIGNTKNVLSLCGLIPFIGTYLSIAGLVCWIIYWVKVAEYKKIIIANQNNFLMDVEQSIIEKNSE
jgi:hypothetical protein